MYPAVEINMDTVYRSNTPTLHYVNEFKTKLSAVQYIKSTTDLSCIGLIVTH